MTDLIILGDGLAAEAAEAAALGLGLATARPRNPPWSVVAGYQVDLLGPAAATRLIAPRLLAITAWRDVGLAGRALARVPGWDIPRLLRAAMRYDPTRLCWMPVLDLAGRTTRPGLYAAEDQETALRAVEAAANDRDQVAQAPTSAGSTHEPAVVWPADWHDVPSTAVACPCESVTIAQIAAAAAEGAATMNQLKAFTRCGMGACQGRECEDVVAALLARHVGGRELAGQWTIRPPLHPVPLEALLGDFTYADIPVPAPAPL